MKSHRIVALTLCLLLAACASNPEQHVNASKAAQANANLGIDYLRKGNNEQALEKLKRALDYDDDNVNANWGLGIVYSRMHEPDKAGKYYQRAIDRQPRPEILNSYGVFLCEQGDTDKALHEFKRAADNKANPRRAEPLTNAGLCVQRAGKLDDAERYYRSALKRDAKYVPALRDMARLSYQRARYLQARAFLQRLEDAQALKGDLLLLGAKVELAQGDRDAAADYLRKYNENHPAKRRTVSQLQSELHE